jgi:3-hydroxyacyl-CoA dehydrogenase
MWHADTVGLPRVLERIRRFQREHGDRWRPAPLLERLAAEGRPFASLDETAPD